MGASNAVAPRRKWRNRCAIFFRKRMRLFQSSPARGGRVQLQQAFAMHGAFQRFNPHPPVGAGATAPSAAPMPGIARFQSSPARGGGCNPYPQHTPSASVVASGWSVGREWGWIQMEQMERQFGKSHLRRVFWGFFGSICSICSICSMRAARQKSPAPCLGGARLAVRGAIIPHCDHARKVGERLSSMEWQRAFRDYSQRALHSSEARLLQRAN